ncbi:class I SAM-dependent methyltransferase [Aldersonia kunmingensis]|uniref:class I SAM-dependent methyltransferase n=1 Tax=Aldersonia kunmingensis TaxID=408066 RepID=UPI0008374AE8|nr:class I SAM-dependent methyltransferase [Aldersonia kunmingensis]
MLTVDFDRLGIGAGTRMIDVGCGAGRHSFEAYRRGADIVAFDQNVDDLAGVAEMFDAMAKADEVPAGANAKTVAGDALALPFADGEFDCVVASEILEHVPADEQAISELVRVLKPGGRLAVTVPRWLPEKVCWMLSDSYHANEGGHIRIYKADELKNKVLANGVEFTHSHHAHALHAPYWWIKCAVGVERNEHPLVKGYHKLLVWDMLSAPRVTRTAESLLNPLVGKSVALYFRKPV